MKAMNGADTKVLQTHPITLKANGVENQQVKTLYDREGQTEEAHEQWDSKPQPN